MTRNIKLYKDIYLRNRYNDDCKLKANTHIPKEVDIPLLTLKINITTKCFSNNNKLNLI